MPVVAVVNRKGGSGKSTIATHIAAYCAHNDIGVMLGDVDRQQSTRSWLRLREQRHPQAKPILGWAVNQSSALRAPTGISHVVLDTPGGLYGLDLARVVMFADAILMPVCNSVFDRDSAAQCYDELKLLPRISSGRCKLAVVGMRVDNRTLDSAALTQWSHERGLNYLGALRDAPTYVQCIEQGVTLFDLQKETVSQDLAQWQPILDWLEPTLFPPPPEAQTQPQRQINMGNETVMSARVGSLQPVQQSLVQGERLAQRPAGQAGPNGYSPVNPAPEKRGGLMEALGFPNFLRRKD
jgi:chromosome partitioning protein